MTIDISEQQRIIEGLTAVIADQHIEIVRCHDRINELLRFNNEFEERARRAERAGSARVIDILTALKTDR